MSSHTRDRIAAVLKDDSRSKQDRIEELLTMREDARALQRAGTESPMNEDEDESNGLQDIDRALEKLGYDEVPEADEDSAATL
ncbi:hypothetical protein FMN50_15085 [Rhodobacterales bacterium]|nr:hypothetical protein FMN50_15085 [Rhodobacterales bacterium]